MKVGDLVWHVQDVKDGLNIPGLVMSICSAQADVHVRFNDRTFDEIHDIDDLTLHPVLYEDENIMGNP